MTAAAPTVATVRPERASSECESDAGAHTARWSPIHGVVVGLVAPIAVLAPLVPSLAEANSTAD